MPEPTLVLSPRYTPDSRTLRIAAEQGGWHVERLGSWRVPSRLYGRSIVLYGEPLFAEVIAARLSLALLDAPFDWLLRLPQAYLQRSIKLATMGEARTLIQPTFVKPADGRKGFEGKVYTSLADLPSPEAVPDHTPVFLAEPVFWELEFRAFIMERQIITISPYLRAGELALADNGQWAASAEEYTQVRAFLERLLADPQVSLPPAIVIDTGLIRGKGWAVIEANTAWGAGIYGCDPARVLAVLARACRQRSQLTAEDARWARPALELEEE